MSNITLYSTGCPQCNVLKKKLSSKGIAFSENTDTDQMLSMNFTRVPVLDVDGKRMEFAEANQWINEQEAKN